MGFIIQFRLHCLFLIIVFGISYLVQELRFKCSDSFYPTSIYSCFLCIKGYITEYGLYTHFVIVLEFSFLCSFNDFGEKKTVKFIILS